MPHTHKIGYGATPHAIGLERFLPMALKSKLHSNPNSIIYQIYCSHREDMKKSKNTQNTLCKSKKVSPSF